MTLPWGESSSGAGRHWVEHSPLTSGRRWAGEDRAPLVLARTWNQGVYATPPGLLCMGGAGKGLAPGSLCHPAPSSLHGSTTVREAPETGNRRTCVCALQIERFLTTAFGLSAKGNYQKLGVRNNIIRRMCFPIHSWHPAAFCGVCNAVNDEKQT